VFFNEAENRMDARDLLRVFYRAMRRAEVKRFRSHDLRHTFAARVVQAAPTSTPFKSWDGGKLSHGDALRASLSGEFARGH
jgi:integrase